MRLTRYLTRVGNPIYLHNGEFYYSFHDAMPFRRLQNNAPVYVPAVAPNNNVNLNYQGRVSNLKKTYNKAARTIQRVERGRASRKRTALRRTIFGRLPNNIFRSIFRR